ncbi:hypothetical protein ACFSO7_07605 [Bacillus sp. CGMCC 1.16607]|uniref:hypothetical protein n=1 Tax=Bacillus sp. CGMCC 1.16607 TaxID=3351842 RepID=UPI0036458C04
MNFEMQKAILLAENIQAFIRFVYKNYEMKNDFFDRDKLYQIKLLIEEYKFRLLADELLRINQFQWDGRYSYYLVDNLKQGLDIIDEYVKNNINDLFLLSARLYTLKNISLSFSRKDRQLR